MDTTDKSPLPAGVTLRHELKPGDIGTLTRLHGVLYSEEQGWDHTFEAYVAGPLSEFAGSHTERERIWIVEKDRKVAGSIAVVEASREEAQLRWLLLNPDLRGQGIGRVLVGEAIRFSREHGYSSVFLWTVSALTPAARLYAHFGFRLTEEETREMWGAVVTEQRYELKL